MGILDNYFNDTSISKPPSSKPSTGVLNQFFNSNTNENSDRTIPDVPHSPDTAVTYSTPAEVEARSYKGGPTSREFPNPATIVGNKALSGLTTMGEGVSDALSNKPASGLGKVGSGALETVFSIPAGTVEFADKLIGKSKPASNSDVDNVASFGDRAGLLVGGAVPVKGSVAIINKLPKNEAFRKLVEDITPEKAGYVAKEMRSNPNLTPADLSPAVKQGTQKLFAGVEGPHINYIADVTEHRLANAAKDLEQHMNTNLGPVVNPIEKLKQLKDNIRAVGKEKINPALTDAKPVDTNSVVKFIDDIAKPGVNSKLNLETGLSSTDIEKELAHIKGYLTDGKSFSTDPKRLNDIQSMFRATSEKLLASQDGASKRMGGILAEVRNKLVDAIDTASGGKYKPALKEYRDEFHVQDAYEHGHDAIIKNGRNISDRPEFFEKQVKDYSEHELQAAREGARLAYDTQMNGFKHAARRGTDIGDVEFNKRRMSALFGKEEADKMFKVFEDAKKVADTNNKLVQGSQTQMRNAQDSYFKPHDPDKKDNTLRNTMAVGLPVAAEAATQYMTGAMGIGAAAAGATMAAAKGISVATSAAKNSIIKKLENDRNMGYAKLALPVEPISREQLIQQLEAVSRLPANKQSLFNRTASKAAKVIPP